MKRLINIDLGKQIFTKRGSALLIALFIMSALGVAAFSATTLFLGELKTSTNISQTQGAFYASEGALEEALLQVKQNPPVETSGFVALPTLANQATIQYRISNSASFVTGQDVAQDDTRQFKINSGDSATLSWEWVDPSQATGVRITRVDASGVVGSALSDIFADGSQISTNISLSPSTPMMVSFKPMGTGMRSFNLTANGNGSIDTSKTTIDVVGEYKNVKRQFQAVVDRNENLRLNGLFSYTLLGEDSIGN